jgi:hypothetical protein
MTAPRRRAYVETSTIFELAETVSTADLRAMVDDLGVTVVVGDALVGELISPANTPRHRSVAEVLRALRADWSEHPPGWTHVREQFRLIRRHHADWIRRNTREVLRRRQMRVRTPMLAHLIAHPEDFEALAARWSKYFSANAVGFKDYQRLHRDAFKEASLRERLASTFPDIPLPDDEADLFWRWNAAQRLHAVTNGITKEDVDYLSDLRRDLAEWDCLDLWVRHATVTTEPISAALGLVRHHQLRSKLRGLGNMVDGLHVIESTGTDLFITGDRRLAAGLHFARNRVGAHVPVAVYLAPPLGGANVFAAALRDSQI